MKRRLTIDEGNTAAKAVVWHDDTPAGEHSLPRFTAAEARRLWDQEGPFESAIYSSTVGCDADAVAALRSLGVRLTELSHLTPMPLVIDYATPHTLGRDRIAAAAGALALIPGRWVLIADLGTACTYDVVDPRGHFLGGNIAPGVFMRLQALNRFTAALPVVETDGECPPLGRDTESAMRSGAIHGVVAEIDYYRRQLPEDAVTVVTGGGLDCVLPFITYDVVVEPNLVNYGLISILNHNEAQ